MADYLVESLLKLHGKGDPKVHQVEGVMALLTHPYFLLADEVGCGKTKQCIDATQILFMRGELDTGLVVTPGFARSTWAEEDPDLGEVAKYAWDCVPNVIHEFHKNYTNIDWVPNAFNWVVTNYEFIRREDRLQQLLAALKGRRTVAIYDESWKIKGFSDQMKACRTLRVRRCERVWELNGTPLSDGKPIDLYYPMLILDPSIIGVQNRAHFKSKYCIMDARYPNKVLKYQNLDDLNARIAPFVLSRRTRDCWDLPPMLDPIIIEARMTDSSWKTYRSMRDDMVSFIGSEVCTAQQAVVKALRLSQICSGFLGGLEEVMPDELNKPTEELFGAAPDWLRNLYPESAAGDLVQPDADGGDVAHVPSSARVTREIGHEKLNAFLEWLEGQDPTKILVWCRFVPELERLVRALRPIYPEVFELRGGQKDEERREAKKFLAPGGDPSRRGAVVGTSGTGGASLNFSGCPLMVFMSNGPELIKRTQSIGRIERPGATQPMQIVDVVATGPKGQKTIDHVTLKALRAKDDMSTWTMTQWRKIRSEF